MEGGLMTDVCQLISVDLSPNRFQIEQVLAHPHRIVPTAEPPTRGPFALLAGHRLGAVPTTTFHTNYAVKSSDHRRPDPSNRVRRMSEWRDPLPTRRQWVSFRPI